MQILCGAIASKTEAIYFPPPRQEYAAANKSSFLVDGTEFLESCDGLKYLGTIIHYYLTSDDDVCKRVTAFQFVSVFAGYTLPAIQSWELPSTSEIDWGPLWTCPTLPVELTSLPSRVR